MSERDERVEKLATSLHDELGGCCVPRFPECVFGGDEIRKEAAEILSLSAIRELVEEARAEEIAGIEGALIGFHGSELMNGNTERADALRSVINWMRGHHYAIPNARAES